MVICLCGDTQNKSIILKELEEVYKSKLLIVNYFKIIFKTLIETESIKYKFQNKYKYYNTYNKKYMDLVNKITEEKINDILNNNKNKIIILVTDSVLGKDLDKTSFFSKSDLNILSTNSNKYNEDNFDIVINKPRIICLCGKSGSGKSTLAKLIPNSIHVDIDKIGHKSHNDEIVKQKIVNIFGDILTDGIIDRKKLGSIVFNDKEAMKKLEKITWEYMEKEIDYIIKNNKDKNIVLDYLLLPRTKYFNSSNIKILLDVPYEVRKKRVLRRDNITEELFDLREKNSIDYSKYNFDIIIENHKKKVKKYE